MSRAIRSDFAPPRRRPVARFGALTVVSLAVAALAASWLTIRAAPPASADDASDAAAADAAAAALAAATKDYERKLGTTLRVASRGHFVVRGDMDQPDMENLAETARAAFDDYVATMGCDPDDVIKPAKKGDTPWVEVFQFKSEKGYTDFLDKVFSRIRDETVDDRRLALMRRQRGMFVLTPRPIVAQYQGPSEISTVRSQVVHKTSHVLLLLHRKAGAWMPWWLLEGLAVRQELSVLKESRTYCLEVDRPGDYFKPGTPEADEAAKARLELSWRKRAKAMVDGSSHRDLPVLAKLTLNELVLDDVIQSWSIVDWMLRDGKLPAFVTAYKKEREFAAACETALGGPPSAVEAKWRASVAGGK
ncbi:MAG: hypothetical protein K8T90_21480 [Planctomycetes bacterium]|nr:hypothetical protein [Planctomycetota bacterium]